MPVIGKIRRHKKRRTGRGREYLKGVIDRREDKIMSLLHSGEAEQQADACKMLLSDVEEAVEKYRDADLEHPEAYADLREWAELLKQYRVTARRGDTLTGSQVARVEEIAEETYGNAKEQVEEM